MAREMRGDFAFSVAFGARIKEPISFSVQSFASTLGGPHISFFCTYFS